MIRHHKRLIAALAMIYALLAGLHTVQDFDLGWQLATGRWILAHRQIPSTDVFSYTARGQEWIYPVLSGITFYVIYLLGGYSLLSWLGAIACAATIAVLVHRGGIVAAALALVCVPLIAERTQPRAEMFTTLLLAIFLSILWQHYRTARAPVWLLPILMIGWVNLHLGFVAGLALCGGYLLLEAEYLVFRESPQIARGRLRKAWPYLLLTGAATFVNPWGPYVYVALTKQAQALEFHSLWLREWAPIQLSWPSLLQALSWRDPQSGFWWLLAATVLAICVALWRRRFGLAALLAVCTYLAFQHIRFEALFACATVVIGGAVLADAWERTPAESSHSSRLSIRAGKWSELCSASALVVTAMAALLVGVRGCDLISNHYYIRSNQLSLFGSGVSWWYPQRAIDFLRREHLPANIFNEYNLGGYLTWQLPEYPDYIDGRAIPFGSQLFFRAYDLMGETPESPAWQQEAHARGVNTIIVSLARNQGLALFPQLRTFCGSHTWRPVYIDEVSALFVRRTSETVAQVDRLQVDCARISFTPPAYLQTSFPWRARAELFNFWANAGGVLYALGRYWEAIAYVDRAQAIFPNNASLHLVRALAFQDIGRPSEAEQEFRASIALRPTDEAWFSLGLFYVTQKRFPEAVDIFLRSALFSSHPHDNWLMLGQTYLQMSRPAQALSAFDRAMELSPFQKEAVPLGARFYALVATGRAKACWQLGDVVRAVTFQEASVKFTPEDPKLWLGLADLYQAQGLASQAEQARIHARELEH